MDPKKIIKYLLYPHIVIPILLLPFAAAFLVYALMYEESSSPIAIIAYVLSAYTLTLWCFRIPYLITFFKSFKRENKYARRWFDDVHLRVKISLYGSLAYNTVYSVFQLWLGFYHHTFWYYSLAVYYISLAVMRFFLLRHTRRYAPGEMMRDELKKYRNCGIIFLIMNLALTTIIFFMVYWNRSFMHHEITAIAMAAYTFISFTRAIINLVKYRKYNSPVFSASKAISLASACVSLLTLESTMFTAFGDGAMDMGSRRLILAVTGSAVTVFVLIMAVYMIVTGTKKLKKLNSED